VSQARRATRLATWALLATGLIALGYAAYVVADAHTYQVTERNRFEQATTNNAAVVPASNAVTALLEGEVIGEIQIRRLGLTAVVAEGDSATTLQHAVGHLSDTALPGELGNVVLAGHRDTFFRPLKGVHPGDAITLKTQKGDIEYLVESTAVVRPSDIQVLEPTGGHTLTLITCFPFSYIGSAPNRFIVRARERERVR
jgi:sortase A